MFKVPENIIEMYNEAIGRWMDSPERTYIARGFGITEEDERQIRESFAAMTPAALEEWTRSISGGVEAGDEDACEE